MGDLARWLAGRCRADRRVAATALVLLAADAALLGLHTVRFLLRLAGHPDHPLAASRFGLNHDDSLGIWLAGPQALALAAVALVLALHRRTPTARLCAAVTVLVAAAKLLKPHLALGEALARAVGLAGGLGLNGVQLGKVAAELGLGILCLLLAMAAVARTRDPADRTAARLGLGLVIGLATTGFAGDLAYMLLAGRFFGSGFVLAMIEGGGELLVLTAALTGFVALVAAAPPAQAGAAPRSRLARRSGMSSSKLRIAEDSALP